MLRKIALDVAFVGAAIFSTPVQPAAQEIPKPHVAAPASNFTVKFLPIANLSRKSGRIFEFGAFEFDYLMCQFPVKPENWGDQANDYLLSFAFTGRAKNFHLEPSLLRWEKINKDSPAGQKARQVCEMNQLLRGMLSRRYAEKQDLLFTPDEIRDEEKKAGCPAPGAPAQEVNKACAAVRKDIGDTAMQFKELEAQSAEDFRAQVESNFKERFPLGLTIETTPKRKALPAAVSSSSPSP